jgi:catechol 2,3-dioxygenase-like lactoylglutathione lyase family enzyme
LEIRELNHSAFIVSDVEKSRYFYGQVLGMDEVARPDSFNFPGAWFRKGSAEVHLIGEDHPGRASELRPANYQTAELAAGHGPHTAFEITDLEEAQQHLRRHKVEVVGGPRPRGDGVMQMFVLDPDNYLIELFVR